MIDVLHNNQLTQLDPRELTEISIKNDDKGYYVLLNNKYEATVLRQQYRAPEESAEGFMRMMIEAWKACKTVCSDKDQRRAIKEYVKKSEASVSRKEFCRRIDSMLGLLTGESRYNTCYKILNQRHASTLYDRLQRSFKI